MKKIGYRILISTVVAFLAVCTIRKQALAMEDIRLLQSYIKDDKIELIISNLEAYDSAMGQIGREAVEVTRHEEEPHIHTIILVDNSLSVTDEYLKKAKEILSLYVEGKSENEEVSLATYGETIEYIIEKESDSRTITESINGISSENRETYLTDVLYEDMTKRQPISEYTRYIVVTDGVDNKYIGYDKDELTDYLKKYPVPVYSLGCTYKNNGDELSKLFAISRLTNAGYYLLDDYSNEEIADGLLERVSLIEIAIPEQLKDGSSKSIQLTFNTSVGEVTLTDEISMPFGLNEEASQSETASEEVSVLPESETSTDLVDEAETLISVPEDEGEEKSKETGGLSLVQILAVIVVILALLFLFFQKKIQEKFGKKKKASENGKEKEPVKNKAFDEFIADKEDLRTEKPQKEGPEALESEDEGATVLLTRQAENLDDERTVLLQNSFDSAYMLVLKDMNDSSKVFRYPLSSDVVIGRKNENKNVNIVLNYEKSVSARHCSIRRVKDSLVVEDLGSSNGTFVNGEKVHGTANLSDGDELMLGRLKLKVTIERVI